MGSRVRSQKTTDLPVGSVEERREGSRTYLIVQETRAKQSVVESWDDAIKITNRLLGRLDRTLRKMNADLAALNARLGEGIRRTDAKIEANQRLLDALVKDRT